MNNGLQLAHQEKGTPLIQHRPLHRLQRQNNHASRRASLIGNESQGVFRMTWRVKIHLKHDRKLYLLAAGHFCDHMQGQHVAGCSVQIEAKPSLRLTTATIAE